MKEKEIFDLDLDDLSSPVARLTHTWCPCTPGEIGVCRLELWGQKGMNFTINGLKSLKRLNEKLTELLCDIEITKRRNTEELERDSI